MIQNILNFIGGNLWLIFIIGAGIFNVSVRIAQKAREQRDLREVQAEIRRQRQEELRTGRPAPIPASVQQRQAAEKQEQAQALEERKRRIEQLRKERIAQLQKLREQATGSASTSGVSARVSPPNPNSQRSQQAARQTASPTSPRSGTPTPPKNSPQQRVLNRSQQRKHTNPAKPAQRAKSARPAKAVRVQSDEFDRLTRQRSAQSKPTPNRAGRVLADPSDHRSKPGKKIAQARSARSMLRSKSTIRQAMVLREVLDPPIALRDDSISSGSLFEM
ncbi:MAG: hypothetical protein ACWA5W_00720 [Phycisphaerales bacterium]